MRVRYHDEFATTSTTYRIPHTLADARKPFAVLASLLLGLALLLLVLVGERASLANLPLRRAATGMARGSKGSGRGAGLGQAGAGGDVRAASESNSLNPPPSPLLLVPAAVPLTAQIPSFAELHLLQVSRRAQFQLLHEPHCQSPTLGLMPEFL